jgi:hypothetical protein
MKRGRGRPSSKPSARAPKALALSADVVITQDFDERGRPRTPLVEVARRTEGTGLLVEEKILFLRVCAAVRRSDSIRVRVGSNWEFPSPISLAATLCDISDRVAHEIHAQFQREKQLPDASQRGQYARKLELEQVFEPRLLFGWIRQIVCRNTAKQRRSSFLSICAELKQSVREYCSEVSRGNELAVSDEQLDVAITYDKVRRWCKRHGYYNNKLLNLKKSKLQDNEKTRALAAAFVQSFIARADDPDSVFIGLDQSYVDEHHARAYGVCNLSDSNTVPLATKKGKRECVCDAICTNANFTVSGELSQLDPQRAQGVRWTFCPNLDNRQKVPVDYHKSFDNENFLLWFMNDMIPAAERAFPGKRLTIIMDNASYHKFATFVVTVTAAEGQQQTVRVKRDSKKEVLVRFIQHHRGTEAASHQMLKAQLTGIFDEIVSELGCDAVRFCKTRQPVAHEILFTPPRFSEWQPIELFWAAVKNEVASKWEAGRGMVKMREQLMAALDRWGDPSPIMGQELSFCGKLWRKVFGLVRSYDTAERQVDDNSDEAIQAADEESESEDVDGIGDDEIDDSDQSDYASDRDND